MSNPARENVEQGKTQPTIGLRTATRYPADRSHLS